MNTVSAITPFSDLTLKEDAARLSRRVRPSTASWETWNDIHFWLRECELNHERCRARRAERVQDLPTRLLYIGAHSTRIFLHSSSGLSKETRYATLSHCWGATRPLRLTADTMAQLPHGVEVEALPPTFRDAVSFAKALGLEYLWIDSLCIIQDSTEDWAHESERMATVYANSFVNIGANGATDSQGGLCHTTQSRWKSVTPLTMELTYTPMGWDKQMVALYPRGDGNILDEGPLAMRGWVVQERLLAPRTIHFMQRIVVWECAELCASETDVKGRISMANGRPFPSLLLPGAGVSYSSQRERATVLPMMINTAIDNHTDVSQSNQIPITLQFPNTTQGDWSRRERIFLNRWAEVVRAYSQGRLTVATDKLIAVSGIAKHMRETLWQGEPLRYHAGLWGHSFEEQLTWPTSPFHPGTRSTSYIAPSWSWASWNGKVLYPVYAGDREYDLWTRLRQIELDPIRDEFGALRSGHIRLRGCLCRAVPRVIDSGDEYERENGIQLLASTACISLRELALDDPNDRVSIRSSSCMVLCGLVYNNSGDSERLLHGIILRLTGNVPGEYRRIGSFNINNPNEVEEKSFAEAIFGPNPNLDYMYREIDAFNELLNEFYNHDLPENFHQGYNNGLYDFTVV